MYGNDQNNRRFPTCCTEILGRMSGKGSKFLKALTLDSFYAVKVQTEPMASLRALAAISISILLLSVAAFGGLMYYYFLPLPPTTETRIVGYRLLASEGWNCRCAYRQRSGDQSRLGSPPGCAGASGAHPARRALAS